MSLPKPSGLPRLSEVKLTRRTLIAGGAALVVAGAGVAVGVTRCSRGAADVPVEPTAGAEASENGAAKLGGNPLNIVDTLPAGMSYVPGSAKYLLYQNPHTPPAANNYRRGDEVTMLPQGFPNGKDLVGNQVKPDASANAVTFSIPTTELGDYAGYAKLTYQTAVKRSELDVSKNEVKFTNSASAESGDKKFDTGSGTVTIKNNVIKKTGEQVGNSNRIKYTILVNESGVVLKNGTDFLELVDTMDPKCTLVPSTLKVYEWVDGAWSSLSDMD